MRSRRILRLAKRCARAICPVPIWRLIEALYYGRFGETELSLLPYLCDPNRDAIDVGANVGCYTLFMRQYARHVYAFEPIPWLAVGLAQKFTAADVTVLPMGLSRSSGCVPLHIPVVDGQDVTGLSSLTNGGSANDLAHHDIAVAVCPLDHAFAGDVGFVKIDVEGHEEAVLDGARGTIARCRPNVLIELEERHAHQSIDHVQGYFDSLDYRGYFLRSGRLRPLDEFNLDTMQRPEDLRADLRAPASNAVPAGKREYTNNFLFVPGERTARVLMPIGASLDLPISPVTRARSAA